jgi:hypothetical protein
VATTAHILEVEHRTGKSAHGPVVLLFVAAVFVTMGGVAVWWVTSTSGSGDPGGRVLAQLTPTISAIPPASKTTYVWNQEPHQDSCDGLAGSQGWSQVVVQSAFKWPGSAQALAVAMTSRLNFLGWGSPSVTAPPTLPEATWTKSLSGGSTAQLSVTQQGSYWQLDAIAPPVGKVAGGC